LIFYKFQKRTLFIVIGVQRINDIYTLDTRTFHWKKYDSGNNSINNGDASAKKGSAADAPAATTKPTVEKKSLFGGLFKGNNSNNNNNQQLQQQQDKANAAAQVHPLPRERHAACLIHYKDKDYSDEDISEKRKKTMILFGGIGDNKTRLNDVYFLNTSMYTW